MTDRGEPSSTAKELETPTEHRIRLKVVNGETGESRFCGPDEAKTWDWGDPTIMRIISGWQIPSFERLAFMMQEKGRKGETVVEMLEIPRFMVLSGG